METQLDGSVSSPCQHSDATSLLSLVRQKQRFGQQEITRNGGRLAVRVSRGGKGETGLKIPCDYASNGSHPVSSPPYHVTCLAPCARAQCARDKNVHGQQWH
ncbi:hypothetical protein BaRGS_00014864 [Batillaria attramentaria]|uniref:Uncharacterized protein n=1 Tax=Batillaria attramentaria TaxID=370345 RepID=A0ABD0L3J2_9CAEN